MKKPSLPRHWCEPAEAFGEYSVRSRVWHPPKGRHDPMEEGKFRRAVLQHAIALSAIRYKNHREWTLEQFASRDDRHSDPFGRWSKLFNGSLWMTPDDMALLLTVLPEAWPHGDHVALLIAVAEGARRPPLGWTEIDTSQQGLR